MRWFRRTRPDEAGLATLEKRLGVRFRRSELLERALTHRSYAYEREAGVSYERLEFLGDAVLGLISAEWLYERFPDLDEGRLTELNSYLVSRQTLATAARELGLGELIRLGVGEERSGGRDKASLLADVIEAVLGAVFVDRGWAAVRGAARPLLERALERRELGEVRDAKTRLQEALQARGLELPVYLVVEETGPDHRKRFTVECRAAGGASGRGEGRSKKHAEQRAAAAALAALERDGDGAVG